MISIRATVYREDANKPWLMDANLPWYATWEQYMYNTYINTGKMQEYTRQYASNGLSYTMIINFTSEENFAEFNQDPTVAQFKQNRDNYYSQNNMFAYYERVLNA